MLGDFIPIIHEFPHNRGIKIYPVSDMHIGSPEFNETAWKKFKKQLMSEDDSYITLGGDILNTGIKSSVSNIYEEVMRPREQKDWATQEFRDIAEAGKILAVVPGNHEYRSAKEVDANPLYDVCARLGIEHLFRENAGFIILRMGDKKANGKLNPTYSGCIIHGAGGGRKTGSALNRNEDFASMYEGVDFFFVGHTHKPISSKPEKIVFDAQNKKIRTRQTLIVVSTSWLNFGGYALKGQMSPATIAPQEILLSGDHKEMKYTY